MQELDLLRSAIGVAFFAYASISDWRTRRVKDVTWIVLGSIALALICTDLLSADTISWISISLLLPIAFVFYDIFWNREGGLNTATGVIAAALYIASFAWIGYIGYLVAVGECSWTREISGPFVAFAMIIVFELFYMLDIVRGGADAKALICLAILFPWYPEITTSLPLIVPQFQEILSIFTFSLSVLFVGALITAFMPLYFVIRNVRAGEKIGIRSFVGFTVPIHEVEEKRFWLIEWVEEGKPKFNARRPRDTETLKQDLAALGALGIRRVWVTYKIPFIIPLAIGMVFILIVGNPIFAIY